MHGYFGAIGVWTLYLLAQLLHILLDANDTVRDKNHPVDSFKMYFQTYAFALAGRLLVTSCIFAMVWDNPKIPWLDVVDNFMSTTKSEIGLAGLLGWFTDSLFAKILAYIPFLQGKLPTVPGGNQ